MFIGASKLHWTINEVLFTINGAFGSLDVILQHDVRFLESLIYGITSWEYKIMVFGLLVTF